MWLVASILGNAALVEKTMSNNSKNYFAKILTWQLENMYRIMVATTLEVMNHNLAAGSWEGGEQGAVRPQSVVKAPTKGRDRPGFKFWFQNF